MTGAEPTGVGPTGDSLADLRVGLGTDIHAFAAGRELWVAGLLFEGDGLAGHSDGDVVAHACCNALLTAANLGDLGSNFGTNEPEWAGASGIGLLSETARRVTAAGCKMVNVSVQLTGPRPRLGPRRVEAESVLSRAAGCPVSVSAATTDGLGFLGRGEGLSATAVALVITGQPIPPAGTLEGVTEPELSPLLRSLSQAVEDCPDDLPLRVHLAEQLLGAGLPAEALRQVSVALGLAPGDAGVLAVLARATAALQAPVVDTEPRQTQQPQAASGQEFDWHAAESELTGVEGILPPPFLDEAAGDQTGGPSQSDPDVQRAGITLADVAGMEHVKERLELAFLTPMRNPELREMYGASMRGGLLLYGPPGCGKTYLARALAGELGAQFLVVGLAEVLDMWIGASEKNLHEVFETARRHAPCVLFLDEVDAIGQKRSQLRGSSMRGTVNQLLTELDGAGSNNDGVFVLAATNHPWDVDPALKRPGRLDRSVLVLPPDQSAREAILRTQLRSKPLSGITVAPIAKATDGWSGADLGALVERAAQRALSDSVRSGQARPVEQRDLEGSLKELGPSIGPWYETAKSVAQFANSSGEYDELLAHLKSRRLL